MLIKELLDTSLQRELYPTYRLAKADIERQNNKPPLALTTANRIDLLLLQSDNTDPDKSYET